MTHGPKFYEMNTGLVWLDLDLDGNLDMWHCQYSYNTTSGDSYRRSRMYQNQGPSQDYRLQDMTWNLGSNVHGAWTAARLDMDNDGDMDLFVASDKEAVRLYRNDVVKKGKHLSIRLKGDPSQGINMDAYGTSVRVYANGTQYYRELQGGGGGTTSSQNSSILNFGVGNENSVDSVVVRFPNGLIKRFDNVATGKTYTVTPAGISTSAVRATDADQDIVVEVLGTTLKYRSEQGVASVTVLNVLGQSVLQISGSAATGEISLNDLPSGVYLVRLATAQGEHDRTINLVK